MTIFCDGDDGNEAALVLDKHMMFGDVAAANISSRFTGLVCWLLHLVGDRL